MPTGNLLGEGPAEVRQLPPLQQAHVRLHLYSSTDLHCTNPVLVCSDHQGEGPAGLRAEPGSACMQGQAPG